MTNEVAQLKTDHVPAMAMDEGELLKVLGNSIYPGASNDSIKMVLGYCKASGLDPMQKPAHIVPMWDGKSRSMRDVIMPGIGLYRIQAARSGEYAGISDPEFGDEITETIDGIIFTYPVWCKVVVKRLLSNGTLAEFSAIERWKENYAVKGGQQKSQAPNVMWVKRPYGQIAKCTEAQALRKAFPECGAAPTAGEMEGKSIDITDQTTAKMADLKEPEALKYIDDAVFQKNMPTYKTMIQSGMKSASDVMAFLSTKGQLMPDQCAALNAINVDHATDAEVVA